MPMKKRFFIIIFTLLCFGLHAENQKNSFDISVDAGFLFGKITDYVLYNEEALSRLDYNLSVPFVSLQADVKLMKWIYIGADIDIGIPCRSGTLEDRDWMNIELPFDYDYKKSLTNFSEHENYLLYYLDARIAFGANFDLPFNICLKPYISYSYDDLKLEARNGYYKYGKTGRIYYNGQYFDVTYPFDEEHDEKKDLEGKIISFRQNSVTARNYLWSNFGFGLSAAVNTIPFLSINATVGILPFYEMVYEDNHHARDYGSGLDFAGIFTECVKFYADADVLFKIDKINSIGIKAGLSIVTPSVGKYYTKTSRETKYNLITPEKAKDERNVYKISLIYNLSL